MLIFEQLKLKEQESYLDKKMQELLINEGELIQQRTDLENQQKQLCSLLNGSPIEFDESSFSIAEICSRFHLIFFRYFDLTYRNQSKDPRSYQNAR